MDQLLVPFERPTMLFLSVITIQKGTWVLHCLPCISFCKPYLLYQVHFNVFSSPKNGRPWGIFTTDSDYEGAGPSIDIPDESSCQSASKVSSVRGGPWNTVLVSRLRFKPDGVEPTTLWWSRDYFSHVHLPHSNVNNQYHNSKFHEINLECALNRRLIDRWL